MSALLLVCHINCPSAEGIEWSPVAVGGDIAYIGADATHPPQVSHANVPQNRNTALVRNCFHGISFRSARCAKQVLFKSAGNYESMGTIPAQIRQARRKTSRAHLSPRRSMRQMLLGLALHVLLLEFVF